MRSIQRIGLLVFGWCLVLAGLAITPLPPPFAFGIILLAVGLAILSTQSRFVRRAVQRFRHRYPGFSSGIERTGSRLPHWLRNPIHRTRPSPLIRLQRRRRGTCSGQAEMRRP